MNDGEAEGIARLLSKLKNLTKVKVLPYHGHARDKYAAMGMPYELSDIKEPNEEELAAAEACLRAHGLTVQQR